MSPVDKIYFHVALPMEFFLLLTDLELVMTGTSPAW